MWTVVPLLLIALIGVYFFFFARRALRLTKLSPRSVLLIAIAAAVCLIAPSLGYFFGWSVWVIVVLYLFFFCIAFDLLALLWRLIVKKKIKILRRLYVFGVFPVLITASLLTYGAVNIYDVRRTEYTVTSDKLTRGYKLALLTDTHYGLLDNRDDLSALAASLSEEGLDVVLLGGDITDESTTLQEVNEIFEIFGSINSTYGTYYVYGNHDTGVRSRKSAYTKEQLDDALARNGVTLLADESVVLDELLLVGRKDRSMPRKSAEELLQGTNTELYRIQLDHSPYELEEAAASGFDISLSGHTHAGQIFPLGVFNVLFGLSGDLNYGKEQFGDMTAIVSSGVTGWGFPIRTQGISEYVIVEILPE